MKKILVMLAVMAGATALTPATATARDSHHHSDQSRRTAYHCRSCHTPVYQVRHYAGRDRYGRPYYRWQTVSHRCSDRGRHHDHDDHRGGFFGGRGVFIPFR